MESNKGTAQRPPRFGSNQRIDWPLPGAQRTPEWPGCARFLADCCPTPGMTIAYSATLVQMEWADPLRPFSSTSMDLRH